MATAPERQGEGIGGAVLRFAADYVRAAGGVLLWANTRQTAEGFYAVHGWLAYGETFTDEEHTIPHRRMFLPIRE
jgi:GNAT superfamily N-acetyltransferase